jgi:hypothetical protein
MDDNSAIREAYRRGARDGYEATVPFVNARRERAICEWLKELDAWTSGDPPVGPHLWDEPHA